MRHFSIIYKEEINKQKYVVVVYFMLSRLLYLAFSANLGLLCDDKQIASEQNKYLARSFLQQDYNEWEGNDT